MAWKTTKMDLKTAEYIVDIVDAAKVDDSIFPVKLELCEKCGAMYLEELGHDCDNVIELPCHEWEED